MPGWYKFHPKPWLQGQRHEHRTSPSFFTVMVATVDNNNRWQYNRKKKTERRRWREEEGERKMERRREEATPNNSVATLYLFLPIVNVVLFLPGFSLPTNTGHLILSLLSLCTSSSHPPTFALSLSLPSFSY